MTETEELDPSTSSQGATPVWERPDGTINIQKIGRDVFDYIITGRYDGQRDPNWDEERRKARKLRQDACEHPKEATYLLTATNYIHCLDCGLQFPMTGFTLKINLIRKFLGRLPIISASLLVIMVSHFIGE